MRFGERFSGISRGCTFRAEIRSGAPNGYFSPTTISLICITNRKWEYRAVSRLPAPFVECSTSVLPAVRVIEVCTEGTA